MMALATRIIPQLLCRGKSLVKGKQYRSWRSVGVAAQAVRVHQMRQVDEIMLLDISATLEGRGPDLGLVRGLADVCFSPLSVGGGVKSMQDIRDLLNNGADKVVIGTAAAEDRDFIARACDSFGSSTIVAAVDVYDGNVMKRCGLANTDVGPLAYSRMLAEAGVGEIILTDIEREGMMTGYNLDLISAVSASVSVPVIASGGCGSYQHMAEAIDAGASAVSSGAMFQFTNETPAGAAGYLGDNGYEVRV
jgi:cyclase